MSTETIYHYTSANAYINIILNRKLWVTDIFYQNDAYEGMIAKKQLKIQRDHPQYSDKVNDYNREIINYFLNSSPIIYMTCFSDSGSDNLSLYRTYTPPDGGYSIGFEKAYLENIDGASLVECVYDEKTHSIEVRKFLNKLIDQVEKIKDRYKDPKQAIQDILQNTTLRDEFNDMSVKFKSPEFLSEKEFRLIFGGVAFEDIKYRVSSRQNVIVPYREINLPNNETSVTVCAGPNSHKQISQHSYQQITATANALGSKWKFIKRGMSGSGYRVV